MLLEDVWGTDFPGETRTVDVHVGEVRRKLGAGRPADRDASAASATGSSRRAASRSRRRSRPRRPADRPADAVPASLTGRIVGAFALLAIVLWLAIGATMFVVLRGLHADATSSSLADIAQTLRRSHPRRRRRPRGPPGRQPDPERGQPQRRHRPAAGVATGRSSTIGRVGPGAGRARSPSRRRPRIGDTLTGLAPFTDGDDPRLRGARPSRSERGRAAGDPAVDGRPLRARRRSATSPGRCPIVILVDRSSSARRWRCSCRARSPVRCARLAERDERARRSRGAPRPSRSRSSGPREVRDADRRGSTCWPIELARTRARESELLADLRHDLRTPLTVIGGYADGAGRRDGDRRPAAERAAAAIVEETARLERLVGELGAIDRLRTGSDALRLEPLDAGAVLAATVERFAREGRDGRREPGSRRRPAARPDGGPLALAADRLALDRILGNLVDNALARPRPGWPRPPRGARRSRTWPASPAPAIAFSVVDDGPGFPPGGDRSGVRAVLPRRPVARSGGGSGLGLAIVRELARAHGGTAIAENLVPHGARVSVVLPVAPPSSRPGRVDGPAGDGPATRRLLRRRPARARSAQPVSGQRRIAPGVEPMTATPPSGRSGRRRRRPAPTGVARRLPAAS